MNLKNIKHARGTGTMDDEEPYSSSVFFDYGMLMLKILAGIGVFNWITSCNFLNALNIDTAQYYPTGSNDATDNPYCYGRKCMVSNQDLNDPAAKSQKTILWMMKWWWQATQMPGYKTGGWLLNSYFTKLKEFVTPMHADAGDSIFSFIKWGLFGLFAQLSMWVMLLFSFVLSIPGYIQGLFSFTTYTGLESNSIFRYILNFWLFWVYLGITFCLGWVSFFPVIYACIHLLYLFFIKPLSDNATGFSTEFTKRMKPLIVAFIIAAIIIAFIQLPVASAGTLTGIMILAWLFMVKTQNTA
jgi:hypothetical protein